MSSVLDEVIESFEPSPETLAVLMAAQTAVLLGIDIGTSGVRAALFDDSGHEVPGASAQTSRDLSTESGFAEMDAEAAVDLVIQTIDELFTNHFPARCEIELISISCFWHSLLGIDSSQTNTTPILTWADTRSAIFTKELRAKFDEQDIHARTGCRFHPSYWPSKLLWLRKEHTTAFKNTRCWVGFGEYLTLRLFGETAKSVSMASATGLFNQRACEWDYDFIRALDISVETLPELAQSHTTAASLLEKYALRWPQLRNAQLCPAIGDGAANNIGAGCHSRDRAALMVGTSGALRSLYKGEPPDQLPGALWCYRADRTRVVVGGALSDGGGLYRWLIESFAFNKTDQNWIQNGLAEMQPDDHGLTVLPFWTGERSTGWTPGARGAILGLSLQTQPLHILRASMEAVAYRFALIFEALRTVAPVTSIIAAGNALRSSPLWSQIIADVLNQPLMFTELSEASMRGAALLALEAAGKIQSIEKFSFSVERAFEPDAARHSIYQRGLARQQKYYNLVVNAES